MRVGEGECWTERVCRLSGRLLLLLYGLCQAPQHRRLALLQAWPGRAGGAAARMPIPLSCWCICTLVPVKCSRTYSLRVQPQVSTPLMLEATCRLGRGEARGRRGHLSGRGRRRGSSGRGEEIRGRWWQRRRRSGRHVGSSRGIHGNASAHWGGSTRHVRACTRRAARRGQHAQEEGTWPVTTSLDVEQRLLCRTSTPRSRSQAVMGWRVIGDCRTEGEAAVRQRVR